MAKTTTTTTPPPNTDALAADEARVLLSTAGALLAEAREMADSGSNTMLEALTCRPLWASMVHFSVVNGAGVSEEAASLWDYVGKRAPFVNDEGKAVRSAETGFRKAMLEVLGWHGDPKDRRANTIWTTFTKCLKTANVLLREDLIAVEVGGKIEIKPEDPEAGEPGEEAAKLMKAATGSLSALHTEAQRVATGAPAAMSQTRVRAAAKATDVSVILDNADNALKVLAAQAEKARNGDAGAGALTTDQLKAIRRLEKSVAKILAEYEGVEQ